MFALNLFLVLCFLLIIGIIIATAESAAFFGRITMFKNRKGLNFKSQKTAKNRNGVFLAVTLICFSLILGALSFLMLLRHYDYDLKNMVRETQSAQHSEENTTLTQGVTLSGQATFLFAHISDDKTEVRSVFYIKADLDNRLISILPISPLESDFTGGAGTTLLKSLSDLGADVAGYKADRYILITDSGLLNALKYLGDLRYEQSEKLIYKTDDLVLDIPKGEQLLSPDTVLRLTKYNYIKYKGASSQENAKVLTYAINTFFNKGFAEKSESYFSNLINHVQSDITAVDFAASRKLVEALAQSMDSVSVTVTDSLLPENSLSQSETEGAR